MALFDGEILPLVGWASVTGSDGTSANARGVTTARTGTGVYTVTLQTDENLDADRYSPQVTPAGATGVIATATKTSASVCTVRTFSAPTTAADADFEIEIRRASDVQP